MTLSFEKVLPLWDVPPKDTSQPSGPLSNPSMGTWLNKEDVFTGAANLCHTHFDRLFPSVTIFNFGGLGEGGKVKWGGWKGAPEEKETPTYLDTKFFTKVGEQILIPVSCFAVQPHNMVGTPSDPASNQLQDSTQTLPLSRIFKRHLPLLRIAPFPFPAFTDINASGDNYDLICYPTNFLLETWPRPDPHPVSPRRLTRLGIW